MTLILTAVFGAVLGAALFVAGLVAGVWVTRTDAPPRLPNSPKGRVNILDDIPTHDEP